MISKNEAKNLCKEIEYANDKDLYNGEIANKANKIYQYITQAPSEEEMCKALSEWWGDDVRYKDKEFYCWLDSELLWIRRFLLKDFPPHLITMIGKFYQSLEEENNDRN